MSLTGFDIPVSSISGIGPKLRDSYESMGIKTAEDLLLYAPKYYEDRSNRICIGMQTKDGPRTNTIVTVEHIDFFGGGRKNVRIRVRDTYNHASAFLMGFNRPYLAKSITVGKEYSLYANVEPYGALFTASAFELNSDSENKLNIVPVYSVTGSVTQKTIRKDIKKVLVSCNIVSDIPTQLYAKYNLMPIDEAIRKIHEPQSIEEGQVANRTLAFREVFLLNLAAYRESSLMKEKAVVAETTPMEEQFIQSLPFSLTEDQKNVLEEIRQDMSQMKTMNRLLQGDVGCGKTLVALIAALHIISSKGQVAFMAPTDLLARQHAQNASKLFEHLHINIVFLDGSVHGKSRSLLLEKIKNGEADLIIGTHALFSSDVIYKDLRFVIVDEQHRFGVNQRNALIEKGQNPDILLMTATPIPRTLALTVFGTLSVSSIKTMPVGRKPVVTYLVAQSRREEMYEVIRTELKRGHKAYFVYPRIDSEDTGSLQDVKTMFDFLQNTKYPEFRGAEIHSKLDDEEKIKILDAFVSGELNFLVATSVVEVGIDVKDATCMVIEQSPFFGMSALHQLRGRVGRSELQSWCFLVYDNDISDDGKKRLTVLKQTNDGFRIAEEDLKIRGPGEICGLRQSGFLHLKYASLERDLSLMTAAKEEVKNYFYKK